MGIAQDGGVPQAGSFSDPANADPSRRRLATCLGLVDPLSNQRWMFEATPHFPEQLQRFQSIFPAKTSPGLAGIFITHAHIGHYTGLMFLGREVMGARDVPVYTMPGMKRFLESNGPWEQLVRLKNIELRPLEAGRTVELTDRMHVIPFLVPHRQEYSEVVGFRITGPRRSVLFIPDIDSWEQWDAMGRRLEDELTQVDVAYLDGTFYSSDELSGRAMSSVPHPLMVQTMHRLLSLPAAERAKVRFIHLNHSNPALNSGSEARGEIERLGFQVAQELDRVDL